MWRKLITSSFLQGARIGAGVGSLTLAVSIFGAVAVLVVETRGASPETTVAVASDAPSVPGDRVARHKLVPVQIDRALLQATERAHPSDVGELLFELSREAAVAAETAEATPPPPPEVAAPVAPRLPPLIIPGDQLFAAVESAFPEDPAFAYGVLMCESAGNATVNSGNGYYGLWQFDLGTWQSVGGAGLPSNASVEEQMNRARMLYDARGWQPWGCARH